MTPDCPHDDAQLQGLRDWAWARGRTDIVLALDLHARVWALRQSPTRAHLRELEAIAPPGRLRRRLHELTIAGGTPSQTEALSGALEVWCERSCRDIEAAIEEMQGLPVSRDRPHTPG